MRDAKVPIDMSSEQKNLMGVVSTRQAIYLAVGGSILYGYLAPVGSFLIDILGFAATTVICMILAIPVIAIVGFLGFFPVEKYNMNRDYYMYIKFQRATNVGLWRKGR